MLKQIEGNQKEWKVFRADILSFIEEVVKHKDELLKIKEEVEIQRADFFNDLSGAHNDEDFVSRLVFVNGLLPEMREQQERFCELSASLFNLQSIIRNYALQIEQGEAENLQLALKAYQSRINGDKRQEQLSRYLNGAIKALSPKAAEEISSRIGNVHLIQKSDVKHDAVS
jgi:cyclopropane fatty-acyl-phospholipid synthase-like methyltransferase